MVEQTLSLSGVFPPIPTPFGADGRVDLAALASNLDRWNTHDLSGYVVLGSNGEGVLLDLEERGEVWDAARRNIPPSRLMIAGTGAESTRGPVRPLLLPLSTAERQTVRDILTTGGVLW